MHLVRLGMVLTACLFGLVIACMLLMLVYIYICSKWPWFNRHALRMEAWFAKRW
jgi:hypothetical protein